MGIAKETVWKSNCTLPRRRGTPCVQEYPYELVQRTMKLLELGLEPVTVSRVMGISLYSVLKIGRR